MTTNGGGYERSDAHVPTIWRFIAALFALIAVALLLMLGMFRWFYRAGQAAAPEPTLMEAQRVLPPAPRLQVTTAVDIEQLRQREEQALTTYGWVDKNAGVVRIPVSRAIDLMVERGLPQTKK
jgi:hypothetical protein